MINVRILGMVVAAFIAGTFAASPELRAFAANTIGSADIIDGSIQSIDIGTGQVKTADIGGSAVTSAKIAAGAVGNSDIANNAITSGKILDGSITASDVNQSFMKKVTLHDDTAGNALGWVPQTGGKMTITDSGVSTESTILVNLIYTDGTNEFGKQCYVGDVNSGNFQLICNFTGGAPPIDLRYIVINS